MNATQSMRRIPALRGYYLKFTGIDHLFYVSEYEYNFFEGHPHRLKMYCTHDWGAA